MKLYRAIIRDTNYGEAYKGSVELFKSKKSLKEWFEQRKDTHYVMQMNWYPHQQTEFREVLIGIEEVNVK